MTRYVESASKPSLLSTARIVGPSLRPSERRVVEWLTANVDRVPDASIVDVQRATGTGAATVVRACKVLGYNGFHELKIAAAREPRTNEHPDTDGVTGYGALRAIERAAAESVRRVSATVSEEEFDTVVAVVTNAERLLVFGAAWSGPAAADTASRFRAAGWFVDAPPDETNAGLCARTLTAGDACLLFSHTGATRVTLDVAAQARRAGAPVVAVVSQANSALSEIATVTLAVAGDNGGVLGIATGSRLAQLVVAHGLLTAAVTARGPRAQAALDRSSEVFAKSIL
ncbi:MurR/RpiR family transcriptional regulator [Lentzea sp. NPDC059081]|uniref:MurR/RpiR family transcriptional regulator n=1 Tax=Lentzea sp. NPDC059081 TaxID=3346719 RepID=UPI00369C3EDC